MWGNETRLFFVTTSSEDNEEIFETLQEARKHFETIKNSKNASIQIALVKNAYKEKDLKNTFNGGWNYEDFSDTFEFIKEIN